MPSAAHRYTVEEILAFPTDGNRYELVDGELLVTPAPTFRHQIVVGLVYHALETYLGGYRDLARAVLSPADIVWGRDELAQPDVFVVPAAEVSRTWQSVKNLLLAAEVVSPSSVRADRVTKRRMYQKRGVATYWVVDADAQLMEVWHPGDERPEVVTETLRWRVGAETDELVVNLAELFANLPE